MRLEKSFLDCLHSHRKVFAILLRRKLSPNCSSAFRLQDSLRTVKEWVSISRATQHIVSVCACAQPVSEKTKRRLAEWERKFGAPEDTPRLTIRSYEVVSPIPTETTEQMSDEQWLQGIAKCERDRGIYDWKRPERGAAYQLAEILREFAKKERQRFALLTLRFPQATNPSYFMNVLYGPKDARVESSLEIDVARRVFASDDTACLMAALNLIGCAEEMFLSDNALQFIQRMATEHPHYPMVMRAAESQAQWRRPRWPALLESPLHFHSTPRAFAE